LSEAEKAALNTLRNDKSDEAIYAWLKANGAVNRELLTGYNSGDLVTKDQLEQAVREAVAAEREACAKTAEAHLLVDWVNKDSPEVQGAGRMRNAIVTAIRTRTDGESHE
jgi:hypothetical protein